MAAALIAILVLRSAEASGARCSYFATPPPTPAKGAVLWWKSDNPYAPNTLVLSVGDHFTDVDNCYEPTQSPWVISVAPGGALVFYGLDASTGKQDALICIT
jgi:hypothetical protein